MKLFKKIAAGLLLSWGFICLMITVSELPNLLGKNVTPEAKAEARDTAIGGIALGFPPGVIGTALVWEIHRKAKKDQKAKEAAKEATLRGIFFRMIEENRGDITILRFAKETNITIEEAKEFLDRQAIILNATFDVNENGNIFYHFSM